MLQRCFYFLILIKCHYCYQSFWGPEYNNHHRRIPQDVMVEVVNNLALKLLAIHNEDNENNIAISPYGALTVLVALIEGTRGDAMYEIQHAANIPKDLSITRIGLRDIHRHLKSYFIPDEGFLSGLTLSHDNVTLKAEYEEILKFYGFDINSFNNALYPEFQNTTTTSSVTTTGQASNKEDNNEATTVPSTTETERITRSESTMLPTATTPTGVEISTTTVRTTTNEEKMTTIEETTVPSTTETERIIRSETTTLPTTTTPTTTTVRTTTNEEKMTTIETTVPSTTETIIRPESTTTPTVTTTVANEEKMSTIETTSPASSDESTIITSTTITTESTTFTIQTESSTVTTETENFSEREQTTVESLVELLEDFTTSENVMQAITINNTELQNAPKMDRRITRSVVDYIIARYYDDHTITQRPPPYNPTENELCFLIDGKYRETNIDYMIYDTVLPFHYIPHLNTLALRFPLDSNKYYLLLLLPEDEQGIDKLICDLRLNGNLKYIINNLRDTHVRAFIPSFMLKGYVLLTSTLQKMGIRKVFEPRHSDFSRMTDEQEIYVTNVEQAITVTIRNYVDPDMLRNRNRILQRNNPTYFKADHPFLYFVIDSQIHVTLMEGKVVNPLNSRII